MTTLDDWHSWAIGKHLPAGRLADMVAALRSGVSERPGCEALAVGVERWAGVHDVEVTPIRPRPSPTTNLTVEL